MSYNAISLYSYNFPIEIDSFLKYNNKLIERYLTNANRRSVTCVI